jgi:DHA1 family bicyclomycin/chloramphenicol resistance-like MFS transporter
MATVVFAGMLAATLVCFLVVQPHRLPAEKLEPVVALAH